MRYGLSTFKGDIFGGLTAGVIALPLALAFGVASGAGAPAGLYGAAALGLVAAILGGTPCQVSGPTGPMTVVAASALAAFSGDLSALFLVILIAGALQILFGVLKLGALVRFIPYPVISGFMSGIGTIIILLQLPVLLGAESAGSPLDAVMVLGRAVANIHWPSLAVGGATMAVVFLTPPRVSRILPSPLMALVVVTAAAELLHLDVATIGAVPAGLPLPHLPSLPQAHLSQVATLALALAALGCIDTLLTSIVADSLTGTRHKSNRELIGQGAGNMVAGLFGGLAGAGATMRTVVNIKAGGTTRISGVIHALFLIAVLVGLGPLTARIPLAVLAGILVKVGLDILDYRMLRVLKSAPRPDMGVMVAVFLVTVFVDLIVAVGVGVTLASFMITYRMARQTKVSIHGMDEPHPNGEPLRCLEQETGQRVRVVTVDGPFFFGTAAQMQERVSRLFGTEVVVFDCLDVPFMDLTAAFTLVEAVERFKGADVGVVLALKKEHKEALRSLGYGALVESGNLVHDRRAALDQALTLLKEPLETGCVEE